MLYYWSNACRIMFLMLLPFRAVGPNSLLCLEVSEVLEILFSKQPVETEVKD